MCSVFAIHKCVYDQSDFVWVDLSYQTNLAISYIYSAKISYVRIVFWFFKHNPILNWITSWPMWMIIPRNLVQLRKHYYLDIMRRNIISSRVSNRGIRSCCSQPFFCIYVIRVYRVSQLHQKQTCWIGLVSHHIVVMNLTGIPLYQIVFNSIPCYS